jgi:hypothetical protein
MVGKTLETTLFAWCFSLMCIFANCICVAFILYLMCICCILRVFIVPYVYLLYHVCIAVLPLDAGLLARSQYPEGPATGHLDTGFSWFPCIYKRTLRRFPSFRVATTCLSCSPPDLTLNLLKTTIVAPPSNASKWQVGFNSAFKGLNFLVTFFHICVHVK